MGTGDLLYSTALDGHNNRCCSCYRTVENWENSTVLNSGTVQNALRSPPTPMDRPWPPYMGGASDSRGPNTLACVTWRSMRVCV